jgi:hypothetical protein
MAATGHQVAEMTPTQAARSMILNTGGWWFEWKERGWRSLAGRGTWPMVNVHICALEGTRYLAILARCVVLHALERARRVWGLVRRA